MTKQVAHVFEEGRKVDEYLEAGWVIIPPTKLCCGECGMALLTHPDYDFLYCTNCRVRYPTHQKVQEASGVDGMPATAGRNATDDMGAYLLKGYTMLAQSCPNGCTMPLLREPGTGREFCVGCNYSKVPQPSVERRDDAQELANSIATRIGKLAAKPTKPPIDRTMTQLSSDDCVEETLKDLRQAILAQVTSAIKAKDLAVLRSHAEAVSLLKQMHDNVISVYEGGH
ncbi:hypothetical protein GMRT_14292 [Giardia muris]|uniref:Uncharacterized protein n=1 Tax=Giardia muris TaxID=5742 RepID=A0A4Z1TAB3_GIAMU|nr:hypothetical protein GMRT_14292 [Giardia muris]|eukprot:TNJ30167.1 hypothetical protein GMRT_14292 [Giardia muris]